MLISTLTRLLNSVQIVYLPLLFRNSCPSTNIISLHAYFVNNLLLIDFDYPSVARKCLGDTTRKSRIETVLKSGLHTNTIFSVIWERIHNFSWFTRNNKLLLVKRKIFENGCWKNSIYTLSQNKIQMIKTQIKIFTILTYIIKKIILKSRVWFHWSLLIIQYALSYPHTSPQIYDKVSDTVHC